MTNKGAILPPEAMKLKHYILSESHTSPILHLHEDKAGLIKKPEVQERWANKEGRRMTVTTIPLPFVIFDI